MSKKTTEEAFEELNMACDKVKKEFIIAVEPIFLPVCKFFGKFPWLYWLMVGVLFFIVLIDIYITFLIL
jgi:hypothetical protein